MKLTYSICIIAFYLFSFTAACAQSIDTLLHRHQVNYEDYSTYKKNMPDRSWSNLVEVNERAEELIRVDKDIIENYFQNELFKNRQLSDSLESAKLMLSLYKKESEVYKTQLNDQHVMINTLLIVVVTIGILLLVAVSFLFGSHARNKAARKELDRLWRKQDDPGQKLSSSAGKHSMTEKIAKLTEENSLLKKRLDSIDKLKLNAEAKLKEEIASRCEAEKEIRNLIEQIKK